MTRTIIKDESVLENRKNIRKVTEQFFEEKDLNKERGDPELVPPEEILGKAPKMASDYFKDMDNTRYGKNKHTG